MDIRYYINLVENAQVDLTQEQVFAFADSIRHELGLKTFDMFLTRQDDIDLKGIEVMPNARKQGVGSLAMQKLCAFADKHYRRILLTPAQRDDYHGTTGQARLIKFYKRFGFVLNKGRNKDFTTREMMIRPAKKLTEEIKNTLFPHNDDEDDGWSRNGNQLIFRSVYGEVSLACGRDEGKVISLVDLEVAYVDRRKGYGKKLVQEAIRKAKMLGFTKIWVYPEPHNSDARNFWKIFGIKSSGGFLKTSMKITEAIAFRNSEITVISNPIIPFSEICFGDLKNRHFVDYLLMKICGCGIHIMLYMRILNFGLV